MKPISDPGYPILPIGPVGSRKYKAPSSPRHFPNYRLSYNTCDHNFEFKYNKTKTTKEGTVIKQNYYFCRHCLEEKIEEVVGPQYLKDENCVLFSNFKIPVKDKVHAKEVIKRMIVLYHINESDNKEILINDLLLRLKSQVSR